MNKDERMASFKYSVLQHARENKNITNTCRVFHLSRTIYYEWLKKFNQFGYLGLLNRQRSKPKMSNQIKPDFEMFIYNYIIDYHTYEPEELSMNSLIQRRMSLKGRVMLLIFYQIIYLEPPPLYWTIR